MDVMAAVGSAMVALFVCVGRGLLFRVAVGFGAGVQLQI